MADKIELILLGLAAVIDTVLLLAMLERVNRPLIPIWIAGLLIATWTWHSGSFVHVLLRDSVGQLATWADCITMSAMAGGLLLLPSGFLHGALRLQTFGPVARPPWSLRYAILYAPVLLLIPVSGSIFESASRDFLLSTSGFHVPYLAWLTVANLSSAGIFWSLRNRLELPGSRNILLQVAGCLVAITGLAIAYAVMSEDSTSAPLLRTLVTMSLSVPAICFAWSIFHRRLIPLMLERTLGYGALLVAMLLLHRVVVTPFTERLSEDLNLDFVLIEFVALLALILAWRPLRNRVKESLQYLLGTNITQVRDATRQLSSQLLMRSNDRVDQTMSWFAEAIREVLHIDYVWLALSAENHTSASAGPEVAGTAGPAAESVDSRAVYAVPIPDDALWVDQTRSRDPQVTEQLRSLQASAVFRFTFRSINGRLLLGTPEGGDRFSNEQLNSLSLLLDQFAVTVHNRELEEARQLAERRAMQQEKLSILGLMSGSLAHELRNPLSSIKTISTLLIEDLDESTSHRRDLELIVSEIDRLTETTSGLLQYSRPADSSSHEACVEQVIERLLKILRHLAQQHGVSIMTRYQSHDAMASGSEATLSEIFFNLIRNAIEAAMHADKSPQVSISSEVCDHTIIVQVTDNGSGIPDDLRDTIFEPFVTGKAEGTGLGLYLVSERIRELAGDISCESPAGGGTVFTVKLPVHQQSESSS